MWEINSEINFDDSSLSCPRAVENPLIEPDLFTYLVSLNHHMFNSSDGECCEGSKDDAYS